MKITLLAKANANQTKYIETIDLLSETTLKDGEVAIGVYGQVHVDYFWDHNNPANDEVYEALISGKVVELEVTGVKVRG